MARRRYAGTIESLGFDEVMTLLIGPWAPDWRGVPANRWARYLRHLEALWRVHHEAFIAEYVPDDGKSLLWGQLAFDLGDPDARAQPGSAGGREAADDAESVSH